MDQTQLEYPAEIFAEDFNWWDELLKVPSIASYNAIPPKIKISNFKDSEHRKDADDIQSWSCDEEDRR